jgi:hypothetical protein
MERSGSQQLSAIILLGEIFGVVTLAAQVASHLESPPLVRFTGALLPLEEKGRGSLTTLTVSIQGKKRLFRIANVEKLTGKDPNGWRLIQDLFPPDLRLIGPEALLSPLLHSESEGKTLIIEGNLYSGDRMFVVTAIREPPKPSH